VGAIALAALALAASALQVSREGSSLLVPTPAVTRHDPFAAELERCNAITPTSGRDDACERAWTENRWRFSVHLARPLRNRSWNAGNP